MKIFNIALSVFVFMSTFLIGLFGPEVGRSTTIANISRSRFQNLEATVSANFPVGPNELGQFPFVEGVVSTDQTLPGCQRIISHGAIDPSTNPTSLLLIDCGKRPHLRQLVRFSSKNKHGADDPFGEGVTVLNADGKSMVVQLTFLQGKAFVWPLSSLLHEDGSSSYSEAQVLTYRGQGWGLTTVTDDFALRGVQLKNTAIMSDGSNSLSARTQFGSEWRELISINVVDEKGFPIEGLNSLAYAGRGLVLATLWTTSVVEPHDHINHPEILVINLETDPAKLIARIHLPREIEAMYEHPNARMPTGISLIAAFHSDGRPAASRRVRTSVTNGIVLRENGQIEVYGKNWDRGFLLNANLIQDR